MSDKEILEIINLDEGFKKSIIKIIDYKNKNKNGYIELVIKKGNIIDSYKKDKL